MSKAIKTPAPSTTPGSQDEFLQQLENFIKTHPYYLAHNGEQVPNETEDEEQIIFSIKEEDDDESEGWPELQIQIIPIY